MNVPSRPEGGGRQCCQMAKFGPFLSLDCARVEGVGAQGIKFCHLATMGSGCGHVRTRSGREIEGHPERSNNFKTAKIGAQFASLQTECM